MEDYYTIIDDMGNWYAIELNCMGRPIKIWDAAKKFPGCSVQELSRMYKIEGKREKPFFDLYRPVGYQPTPEEIEYCLQDSRIVAHAITCEYENNHTGMTLSSDAFLGVRESIGNDNYRKWMPVLTREQDAFCRKAYKGGWVYVNPIYQNKVIENVTVYDVNSLYPWVMHDCPLPYGEPRTGIPYGNDLYVMKFKAMFELESGFPTVQIKNNFRYNDAEYLTKVDEPVELSMTNIDFALFEENYKITYMTEPEYMIFSSKTGLLAKYIDNWMKVKEEATISGNKALRYISKRWMNSPYGKTGMKPDRENKLPMRGESGKIYYNAYYSETDPIYVPYATFVCAWARNKTIRSAQAVEESFVYADTDSIHVLGDNHGAIDIDPVRLGAWKNEGNFEIGRYIRAKTYIHGCYDSSGNPCVVDNGITCAGMPNAVKQKCRWDDFNIGSEFPGKIAQKQVPGGVILEETTFRINESGLNG